MAIIQEACPEFELGSDFFFRTERREAGLRVLTSLDFDLLNHHYHKRVPKAHSSLSEALILATILSSERELKFAAIEASDLATSQINSAVISSRISGLVLQTESSSRSIARFSAFYLNGAHAIREAVNRDDLDKDELVSVLVGAKQFKHWLAEIPNDAELLQEYYRRVSEKSFIERLPGKSLRWGFMTVGGLAMDSLGAGGFGTATALGLSVADTFFLEKLVSGWKPDQFIEDELKGLVSRPGRSG